MKTLDKIPFAQLTPIPKLIRDFIADEIPELKGLKFTWDNLESKVVEKTKTYSKDKRDILASVLEKQYESITLSEKQQENLEYLKCESTVTVTTGHQLNLFSGPAFFVYKILQTIKTADEINAKNLGYKAVPIFWLASEDHDFEEINHFKTENNLYEIQEKQGGAVGRISVSDNDFVRKFEEEFRGWPFGEELIGMLKSVYAEGNTLSYSTRDLVQMVFSEYGILVLDGDDIDLKRQMTDIFKDELLNQSLKSTTKSMVEFLSISYKKVQVNPRDINLFYLTETRNRIEFSKGVYTVLDTQISFSEDEIIAELESHPENFSPNALLRPVYQEVVLPNVMYIGGNAEIMYWFELKDYFSHLNLPMPLLTPRNSMLFITEKQSRKAKKLHWEILDLFRTKDNLLERYLIDHNPIMDVLQEKKLVLKQQFEALKEVARKTDKTFGQLVDAEEARQLHSFKRMEKRLLRAEKIKEKEWLERVDKLWYDVHPRNTWQERVYNFSVFYSILGNRWLQTCYAQQDILTPQMVVVEY